MNQGSMMVEDMLVNMLHGNFLQVSPSGRPLTFCFMSFPPHAPLPIPLTLTIPASLVKQQQKRRCLRIALTRHPILGPTAWMPPALRLQ